MQYDTDDLHEPTSPEPMERGFVHHPRLNGWDRVFDVQDILDPAIDFDLACAVMGATEGELKKWGIYFWEDGSGNRFVRYSAMMQIARTLGHLHPEY